MYNKILGTRLTSALDSERENLARRLGNAVAWTLMLVSTTAVDSIVREFEIPFVKKINTSPAVSNKIDGQRTENLAKPALHKSSCFILSFHRTYQAFSPFANHFVNNLLQYYKFKFITGQPVITTAQILCPPPTQNFLLVPKYYTHSHFLTLHSLTYSIHTSTPANKTVYKIMIVRHRQPAHQRLLTDCLRRQQ